MLTIEAFTILLILSGTPSEPPAVLRTLHNENTLEQCRKKAQEIEADTLWKHPIRAICYPTNLLVH